MKRKWIFRGILVGIFAFNIFSQVFAMLPETENWELIITRTVPKGREQLETYKKIFGSHAQKHAQTKDMFKLEVEGLDGPLFNLYARAYERLKEFEGTNPQLTEKLGKAPTAALKQLFLEHVQGRSKCLSVRTFEGYVYDVVELMDLYFHNGASELFKNTLEEIFSKKNIGHSDSFFSPVFLKKDGLSIESINYSYFGNRTFLAVFEVGPHRNAHEKMFSQTNRRFMLNHDRFHADDCFRCLSRSGLLDAFQSFFDKIEAFQPQNVNNTPNTDTVAELAASKSYLQLGLFLLTHEHVQRVFENYKIINRQSILNDAIAEGLFQIISSLKNIKQGRDDNYIVFFKDSFVSIAATMAKHAATPALKKSYEDMQGYLSAANRTKLNQAEIDSLLGNFQAKFMEAAAPLIVKVDQELAVQKVK